MHNIHILFPLKGCKLSPEDEKRLAESTAFKPKRSWRDKALIMMECYDEEFERNEELEYKLSMSLAREAQLKCQLYDRPKSLWQRIKFVWRGFS